MKTCCSFIILFFSLYNTCNAADISSVLLFGAGMVSGFATHEGGHYLTAAIEGKHPQWNELTSIDYDKANPEETLRITSAGFISQKIVSEIGLTFGGEKNPYILGFLIWDLLETATYNFRKTGTTEGNDIYAISNIRGISENQLAALLTAHAAINLYRYYNPDSRLAAWGSRAMLAGFMVGVTVRF